ncbi:MAG: GNAT family N-acetyltransferase [Ferruginibacter sp.]
MIVNEKYVGFVLVRFIEAKERSYFSVAEFFVMKKYRRAGIGTSIATYVFDLHKGGWEVFQKESNKPAQIFWYKVIDEFTNAKFTERFEDGRRIQSFVS